MFIVVFLLLCISTAQAATLLYSNGFDGTFGDMTKMYECAENAAHAFTLVTSPTKSGTHSLRFLSYGEASDMCWEWGKTKKKHRVQAQLGIEQAYPGYPNGLRLYPDDAGPWWLGFSVYVPSTIATDEFILFDIKSASRHFGEPTAYFHSNRLDVRREGLVPNEPKFQIPRDQWVDMVWMIERRKTSEGKMKFWLNGKLELDQTGSTLPADNPDVESWFRIGLYYGDAIRPRHTYIAYFDNIKLARGEEGYALVAPPGEIQRPEIPGGFNEK